MYLYLYLYPLSQFELFQRENWLDVGLRSPCLHEGPKGKNKYAEKLWGRTQTLMLYWIKVTKSQSYPFCCRGGLLNSTKKVWARSLVGKTNLNWPCRWEPFGPIQCPLIVASNVHSPLTVPWCWCFTWLSCEHSQCPEGNSPNQEESHAVGCYP